MRKYRIYNKLKREFIDEIYFDGYKRFEYNKEYNYYHTQYNNNKLFVARRCFIKNRTLIRIFGFDLRRYEK
jgi:hypothetical protein